MYSGGKRNKKSYKKYVENQEGKILCKENIETSREGNKSIQKSSVEK
jgi:hypothetical protein